MMCAVYTEDNLLPLSGLQHLIFCERQAALIHVEGIWDDNRLTVQGAHLHERVHERDDESRPGIRIARGLPLRSLRLGLSGIADVVEFHAVDTDPKDDDPLAWLDDEPADTADPGQMDLCTDSRGPPESTSAIRLAEVEALWRPFPVEYKRGKPKPDRCDEVQLCAQAMCLEEMLDCHIAAGALFYGAIRRRYDVALDDTLRRTTEDAAKRLHALIDAGLTPAAVRQKKCRSCSLLDRCMPRTPGQARSAALYLQQAIEVSETQEET